jgi:flagellar protein FlbD
VITLTRLSGSRFALNSDLIERVDSTPDTVITLVDGTKYVVREDLRSVVDSIREYRGAVIAESARMAGADEVVSANPPARRLVAVPDPFDDDRAGDLS